MHIFACKMEKLSKRKAAALRLISIWNTDKWWEQTSVESHPLVNVCSVHESCHVLGNLPRHMCAYKRGISRRGMTGFWFPFGVYEGFTTYSRGLHVNWLIFMCTWWVKPSTVTSAINLINLKEAYWAINTKVVSIQWFWFQQTDAANRDSNLMGWWGRFLAQVWRPPIPFLTHAHAGCTSN